MVRSGSTSARSTIVRAALVIGVPSTTATSIPSSGERWTMIPSAGDRDREQVTSIAGA
jgi:hypothetical protein